MIRRATDFLFENGERITKLLRNLEEEGVAQCTNNTRIQIHKFLVSVQVLEEERDCIIGDGLTQPTKNNAVKQKQRTNDTKLFKGLKNDIQDLNPSNENLVFLERVEETQRNVFYFRSFIREQVNDYKFLSEFWDFCEKHEALHEDRKSRVAL